MFLFLYDPRSYRQGKVEAPWRAAMCQLKKPFRGPETETWVTIQFPPQWGNHWFACTQSFFVYHFRPFWLNLERKLIWIHCVSERSCVTSATSKMSRWTVAGVRGGQTTPIYKFSIWLSFPWWTSYKCFVAYGLRRKSQGYFQPFRNGPVAFPNIYDSAINENNSTFSWKTLKFTRVFGHYD